MNNPDSLNSVPPSKKAGGSGTEPVSGSKQVVEENRNFLNIFGSPLSYATVMTMYSDSIHIPKVLRDCIVKIEEDGLLEEGIYRKSGSNNTIERLKKAYNEYQNVSLDEIDICVAASLLKLYIRELPETIFTDEFLPEFYRVLGEHNHSTVDHLDEQARTNLIKEFKSVHDKLPIYNQTMIIWLTRHLKNVIEQCKTNKMDLMNILIVFSPNLQTDRDILWFFIKYHTELFGETELTKPTVAYVNPINIEAQIDEISKEVQTLIKEFKNSPPHKKSDLMDRIYDCQQFLAFLMKKSSLVDSFMLGYAQMPAEGNKNTTSPINTPPGVDISRINTYMRNRSDCSSIYLNTSKLRRYTSEITQTEIFLNTNSKFLTKYKKLSLSRHSQPNREHNQEI